MSNFVFDFSYQVIGRQMSRYETPIITSHLPYYWLTAVRNFRKVHSHWSCVAFKVKLPSFDGGGLVALAHFVLFMFISSFAKVHCTVLYELMLLSFKLRSEKPSCMAFDTWHSPYLTWQAEQNPQHATTALCCAMNSLKTPARKWSPTRPSRSSSWDSRVMNCLIFILHLDRLAKLLDGRER